MPIPLGSRFGRSPVRTCVPANGRPAGHRFRKTSLLRIVPTACGQAADIWHRANLRSHAHARQRARLPRRADLHRPTASILTRQFALATRSREHAIFIAYHVITFDARRCASVATLRHDRLSERSFSSRCQISRTRTPGRLPGDGSGIVCSTDELSVSMPSSQRDDDRAPMIPAGGARRDRTDDLLLAKQALSQLSYGPGPERTHPVDRNPGRGRAWWAWEDLNFRPHAYQARALTN
jgi:hypothetical protein